MKKELHLLIAFAVWGLLMLHPVSVSANAVAPASSLRPPAVPLIAIDPYFSVWSCADHLTDDVTRHWTGTPQALASLIRIDGQSYRLMGNEPQDTPALPQVGLRVLPTRTIYDFQGPAVRVTLTFMRPALPEDLDAMARPVTYLTWEVRSVDGRAHAVSIYDDTSAALAVNRPEQRVVSSREKIGALTALRFGSEVQPVLGEERRQSPHRLGLRLRRGARAQREGRDRRRGGLPPGVSRRRRASGSR